MQHYFFFIKFSIRLCNMVFCCCQCDRGDSDTLNYLGLNPHSILNNFLGDCDGDSQCAPGLECYQHNGNDAGPPGCSGNLYPNTDYCYVKPVVLAPSSSPSTVPSSIPSSMPSSIPSSIPSLTPSSVPSIDPSSKPSLVPSNSPSSVPSVIPSSTPSSIPSSVPSLLRVSRSKWYC